MLATTSALSKRRQCCLVRWKRLTLAFSVTYVHCTLLRALCWPLSAAEARNTRLKREQDCGSKLNNGQRCLNSLNLPQIPKSEKRSQFPTMFLIPKKEQLVEQAIRDKALSEACMLLTSSDSPITVDVPTEMKKLHPSEGEPCDLDYIPGRQLNFSSSDVESKLKEFPPGSSGGPSGWRGSHLKEMLTAKCKPSFLSALAEFCTRIANGSPTKARR